jgi:hypothetical protein
MLEIMQQAIMKDYMRFEVFAMLRLVALVRTSFGGTYRLMFQLADSCHPDDGGYIFLRNVGSFKSHMVYHPRRQLFS